MAAYLPELTGELALVARQHGFDTLAYLLEIARSEAEGVTRRPKTPGAKLNTARD